MREQDLGHGSPKGKGGAEKSRRSSQVPDQYLGFSLQATRLLQMLLDAEPGTTCSLELFEDVGVEQADGRKIAVQTKSTFDGNPVADRSPVLWKTFANWADSVENGTLPLDLSEFEIYVSAPRTGQIVDLFHKASSEAEAHAAINHAQNVLSLAENKSRTPEPNKSKSFRYHAARFFGAKQETVLAIVRNFRLVTGSGAPQTDLRRDLERKLVPPEFVDPVLLQALGWIKQQTDSLLERGQPAAIRYDDFRAAVTAFVRKCSAREILVSWALAPSAETVEANLLRTYVRQLELVDCDDDDKLRAVDDFLRASVDRTNWSKAGIVDASSFDEFEKALTGFWRNRQKQMELIHRRRKATDRGKILYYECAAHRARVEGLEVPDHFTPGSFHALAEVEGIGWHPDYKNELRRSVKPTAKGADHS